MFFALINDVVRRQPLGSSKALNKPEPCRYLNTRGNNPFWSLIKLIGPNTRLSLLYLSPNSILMSVPLYSTGITRIVAGKCIKAKTILLPYRAMRAIEEGDLETIETLHKDGFDFDFPIDLGDPIYAALAWKQWNIVEFFKQNVDFFDPYCYYVEDLIEDGNYDLAEECLEKVGLEVEIDLQMVYGKALMFCVNHPLVSLS